VLRERAETPPAKSGAITGASELVEALSIGHRPAQGLKPQDESLFRAFQANLLSLISHELRTPLMGVLNALQLLEGRDGAGDFSSEELVSMARRNAQRLYRTLSALLDLAALESGTFHARLREVDLPRILKSRIDAHRDIFSDHGISVTVSADDEPGADVETALLGDPQKLGRAIDLCLEILVQRASAEEGFQVRISGAAVRFQCSLKAESIDQWKTSWLQAQAGHEGGVAAPGSAFAGTLQSEQAFLSRMEEGLGSEFLLVHEILRRHRGKFTGEFDLSGAARNVTLKIELPELSSEEGLCAVLASRTGGATSELGGSTLAIVQVPGNGPINRGLVDEFRGKIKRTLFRASDAVYSLPRTGEVALVMDDCRPEDAPRLLNRLEMSLGLKLSAGVSSCPEDGFDPEHLIELARRRSQNP